VSDINTRSQGFRQHKDHRTRRDRLAQVHANWSPFLTELADAYVAWKATSSLSESLPSESHGGNMSTPQPSSPSSSGSTSDPFSSYDFNINTIDIYTLQCNRNIHRTSEMKTAVALMSHGLLSNVPLLPSIALSLTTLELYRRLRLRKPSFSVEAFAKVVCDLYMVGWISHLRP
jgi:hypothetical protein